MKLIDKDALVAEIERRLKNINLNYVCVDSHPSNSDINKKLQDGISKNLQSLLSFISALEVKEVNLEKELVEEIYSHVDSIKDTADRMTSGNFMHSRAAIKFSANTIAKVLELIGLKAQKGE